VSEFEFRPWPKTPRLKRSMIVTEKIDGTNACVIVTEDGRVGAQSRNRIITPESDNAGFARWVYANAGSLRDVLGVGYHYGEWWGSGIQRAYGLKNGDKRFSLFNVERWQSRLDDVLSVDGMDVVPLLYRGDFTTDRVASVIEDLHENGSMAMPGFMRPEGVIVYLPAARQGFKVLCENDDVPKGLVA
jgi:hypothetical protein